MKKFMLVFLVLSLFGGIVFTANNNVKAEEGESTVTHTVYLPLVVAMDPYAINAESLVTEEGIDLLTLPTINYTRSYPFIVHDITGIAQYSNNDLLILNGSTKYQKINTYTVNYNGYTQPDFSAITRNQIVLMFCDSLNKYCAVQLYQD